MTLCNVSSMGVLYFQRRMASGRCRACSGCDSGCQCAGKLQNVGGRQRSGR